LSGVLPSLKYVRLLPYLSNQYPMKKLIILSLVVFVNCLSIGIALAQSELQNFIINPSFESISGWQVQMQNGATGDFSFDAKLSHSGHQSLKLSKTNGLGFVELRTVEPISIKADTLYTFRGLFHADNAPLSSLLLFRISTDGKSLSYNSIDRTAGWQSQSLLINSPAGKWHPRAVTYQSKEPQKIYLHVALWGNPSTVWLDDLELTEGTQKGESYQYQFDDPYTKGQVLEALQKRPNATAKVVEKGGRMEFELNGKVQPFVIYKGMEPSARGGDQAAFGKDGVNLTVVPMQLGQSRFSYVPKDSKPLWNADGSVNFDVVDDIITRTLQRNPQANLILDIWAYPYLEWGEKNPDEIIRNAKGEKGYGIWGNIEGYTNDLTSKNTSRNKAWWYPSYQSAKWRHDSEAAFAAIANHLKTSIYGKAVVGFYISGGHDGRFATTNFYDYSQPSESTFRAWTLQKYGSIANVAKAWHQTLQTADYIKVPVFDQGKMESGTPYVNPGQLQDYREFKEKGTWDLRDGYAKAVKEAIGKPVVALCYNAPVNKDFLQTKYLDASGDMSYYPYRNPGYALSWLPGDGYKYHHKMMMQELDFRSWVGARYDEVYQMWIGAGLTPETWDNMHRKMVGVSLAHDYGWWYYDMGRYFNDPVIHNMIANTLKVTQRYEAMPKSTFKPDVCVIERDYPSPYLSSSYTAADSADNYQTGMLESSGVPFESHYLDDVLNNPELQNFKVYIFRQTAFITNVQRRQIKEKLLNKNRTIVWMNDAGYISEKGQSVDAMSDLIGMKIKTAEKFARLSSIISDTDSPYTKDTLPFQGGGEMVMAVFNTTGAASSFVARYQPFWIEDASATPLAKYHETDQTSMAVKKMPGWTSLYIAAPQALEPQLMNNIAKQAGAFVAGDAEQQLDMNGNFASLHGLKNGVYHLQLPPGKTRIVDAMTGKVLLDGGTEYTFPVQAGTTYWFFFE